MKTYGEWMYRSTYSWRRYYLEVSGKRDAPPRFNPGENPPITHWIGGWVGPRTGLETVEQRTFSWHCWDSNFYPSAVQPVPNYYVPPSNGYEDYVRSYSNRPRSHSISLLAHDLWSSFSFTWNIIGCTEVQTWGLELGTTSLLRTQVTLSLF
jgi:hypothetical protein